MRTRRMQGAGLPKTLWIIFTGKVNAYCVAILGRFGPVILCPKGIANLFHLGFEVFITQPLA